jgi:hypothetical protein
MSHAALLGAAAAAVSLVCIVPYVRDTRRGTTRPHRGAWLVWGGLGATAIAAQAADGATWSLAYLGVGTVTVVLVLALALGRPADDVGSFDLALLSVAALGIAGWALSNDPAVATAFVVGAELAGFALMLPKTWRDPWSETLSTWALFGVSGGLGAAAVGSLDATLLLYPAYFALANGSMAVLIATRRAALGARPSALPV